MTKISKMLGFRGLAIVILTIALTITTKTCNRYKSELEIEKEGKNLYNQILRDSINTFKDKNNRLHSVVEVFQSENIETFTKLDIANAEIKHLQNIVNNRKGEIKTGGNISYIQTEARIDTIIKVDSIFPSGVYNFDKWASVSFNKQNDSLNVGLSFRNEYEVIVGKDKKGKNFAEVISLNPYVKDSKIRTYQVKTPAERKYSLGIQAGYGITKDYKPSPYIGIGLNYKLFNF